MAVSSDAVCGQQAPPSPARASLEASLRLTRVQQQTSFLAGGSALLVMARGFSFGGSGWVLLEEPTVETGVPGGGFRLRMSYGGALASVTLLETPKVRVSLRTLVGAGNGKIVLPLSETEIDADNFGVVEPEIAGTRALGSFFHLGVGASYRFVFGVEDLTGVSTAHLRGLSGSVLLSARGF
jgi:hypothetical protein